MERFVDKTIVILCCLLAAAIAAQAAPLTQTAQVAQMAFAAHNDAPEALPAAALVSMMLLAVISTAAYECARSTAALSRPSYTAR